MGSSRFVCLVLVAFAAVAGATSGGGARTTDSGVLSVTTHDGKTLRFVIVRALTPKQDVSGQPLALRLCTVGRGLSYTHAQDLTTGNVVLGATDSDLADEDFESLQWGVGGGSKVVFAWTGEAAVAVDQGKYSRHAKAYKGTAGEYHLASVRLSSPPEGCLDIFTNAFAPDEAKADRALFPMKQAPPNFADVAAAVKNAPRNAHDAQPSAAMNRVLAHTTNGPKDPGSRRRNVPKSPALLVKEKRDREKRMVQLDRDVSSGLQDLRDLPAAKDVQQQQQQGTGLKLDRQLTYLNEGPVITSRSALVPKSVNALRRQEVEQEVRRRRFQNQVRYSLRQLQRFQLKDKRPATTQAVKQAEAAEALADKPDEVEEQRLLKALEDLQGSWKDVSPTEPDNPDTVISSMLDALRDFMSDTPSGTLHRQTTTTTQATQLPEQPEQQSEADALVDNALARLRSLNFGPEVEREVEAEAVMIKEVLKAPTPEKRQAEHKRLEQVKKSVRAKAVKESKSRQSKSRESKSKESKSKTKSSSDDSELLLSVGEVDSLLDDLQRLVDGGSSPTSNSPSRSPSPVTSPSESPRRRHRPTKQDSLTELQLLAQQIELLPDGEFGSDKPELRKHVKAVEKLVEHPNPQQQVQEVAAIEKQRKRRTEKRKKKSSRTRGGGSGSSGSDAGSLLSVDSADELLAKLESLLQ